MAVAESNGAIYELVDKSYSRVAKNAPLEQGDADKVARAFGYSGDELRKLPASANMGLSCGNPLEYANIREGEDVIDLGSGGGMDIILAAEMVGQDGRVYGVDMSKSMLDVAQKNIEKQGLESRVELIEAKVNDIPLPDASADCIISNCVINLLPDADKPRAFVEMYRLLRTGGRLAISDILAKTPLPEHIRNDAALYAGCIAGASLVQEYQDWLTAAGFMDVMIIASNADVNAYDQESSSCGSKAAKQCCGQKIDSPMDFNEWVGSYKIFAAKSVSFS